MIGKTEPGVVQNVGGALFMVSMSRARNASALAETLEAPFDPGAVHVETVNALLKVAVGSSCAV